MAALLLAFFLFGVSSWEASLVTAALATNDVYIPGEPTDSRQLHPHQYQSELQKIQSAKMGHPTPTAPTTYHVEHEYTERAARRYLESLENSEIERVPSWCLPCNSTVEHYCKTFDFINDHCCCEYSHTKEQLPWIPHTCMRQLNERCTANAGSCSKYRAIKECCCDRMTKREYKNKFSAASKFATDRILWPLPLLAGMLHYYYRYR